MTLKCNAEPPTVSLLLVTANRATWLDALLSNIEAQTMTGWEVIAVDCASTDETLERLKSWSEYDSRVRVFSTEETDRAIGRRQALQKARGDFVVWVDPHTAWPPGFLASLLATFDAVPETTGVIYASCEVLTDDGSVARTLPGARRYPTMVRELFEAPQLPLAALLVRRSAIHRLEKTGMRFVLGNDHALILWLAHQIPFEPAGQSVNSVQISPIDGVLPLSLDPVSEGRGEAMTYALENFPRAVPARFARRCLASFQCQRARALSAGGDSGEALSSALRALMYRPLWPRAWKQLLSIVVKGH